MTALNKSLIALALGTFGLGMSEYVVMGILPYMATDFGISIPQAGHFISIYALGVCVGAPLVAIFLRHWPLKQLLSLLVGIMVITTAGMTLCPTPSAGEAGMGWHYWLMMLLRFIAGLPHGAYFGVGSIIADRISKEGKAAFAVSIMCSGMTVANLIGIPLGTFLTGLYSWRLVFAMACLVDVLAILAVLRWIPYVAPIPDQGIKGSFRFLKSLAPWLLIVATLMGNGGIFAWYSYISPTLTELAGVPVAWLTGMMVLSGSGMVIGNLMGGRLSDRFGPGRTGRGIEVVIFCTLVLIALLTEYQWCLIPLMFLACGCLFAVSAPQQLLLIRFSKGGELMGGAMVQLAFNLGNAIGAWLGGLVIVESTPSTYHYPAAIGACLAAIGIVCYLIFCHRYENRKRPSVA